MELLFLAKSCSYDSVFRCGCQRTLASAQQIQFEVVLERSGATVFVTNHKEIEQPVSALLDYILTLVMYKVEHVHDCFQLIFWQSQEGSKHCAQTGLLGTVEHVNLSTRPMETTHTGSEHGAEGTRSSLE